MTCWSTPDLLDEWVRGTNHPEATFDRDSTRVFHELSIRGQRVLQWQRGSSGRDLLIADLTRREEVFLRQRFSGHATISRPAKPEGSATLSIRNRDELNVILHLLESRLHGTEVETTAAFSGRWGEFIYWAGRFHEWDYFDQHERDYKLQIAARLDQARLAVQGDSPDWLVLLKRAFQKPNNLTNWRMHSEFLHWCEQHPGDAKPALNLIWEPAEPRRIRAFLRSIPMSVVSGAGMRLSLASFLQMALDPYSWPFYRSTLMSSGVALTGFSIPSPEADEQGTYDHAMLFLDRICEESADRGLVLRDRLDAQSVLWTVCAWDPIETWSNDDKTTFLTFRGTPYIADEDP